MIDSSLIDQLLEKVSEQTMKFNLKWMSIPQYFENYKNEPLRIYIIENNKYAYKNGKLSKSVPFISEYQSQCICINDGLLIIFKYTYCQSKNLSLAIQVNNFSEPSIIECSDEQNIMLTKLYEKIDGSQYDVSKYIKNVIDSL